MMTTVPFSRVMRVNIKTVFRLRNLILTIFIFSLIGLLGVYMLSGPSSYSSNVWDVLFFTFAGPSIQSESFLSLSPGFCLFLCSFIFLVIIQKRSYQEGVTPLYRSLAHGENGGLERLSHSC